jgi:hypothetical protein
MKGVDVGGNHSTVGLGVGTTVFVVDGAGVCCVTGKQPPAAMTRRRIKGLFI